MAGIVGLTELQHTNGNSMLTVATTGDGNVKSEGGASTTSLRQGLAKAWVNFNGTSTIATRDSLNTASLTDGGTGNYDVNWTNSFANNSYCHSGADGNYGKCNTEPQALSTGEANVYSYNASNALADVAGIATVTHGDLA